MPLSNITGVTLFKKIFQVAAVFLIGETEGHYSWAVGILHGLFQHYKIPYPKVIVTDRELALMKALDAFFIIIVHLLCHWHVNINVLVKLKQFFLKATWDHKKKCA